VTLTEGRPRAHSQSVERSDAIVGSVMVIGEACKSRDDSEKGH
jgi:hypothetical protein